MDRSPCLSCALKDEDKNGPECTECDARVKYVSGLVGRTESVPASTIREGDKVTILESKIEQIIIEICTEHGVDVAKLKQGGRSGGYTPARRAIAQRLVGNYGMSKQKISELTGVTVSAIWHLLNPKITKPKSSKQKNDSRAAKPEKRAQKITVDFSDHPETLIELQKYSKEKIRSVEAQILFFIKEAFEEETKTDGNQG